MMPRIWNWLMRNSSLPWLLTTTACVVWALGNILQGAAASLVTPVALAAAVCSWGISNSRLKPRQAWECLIGLGLPGIFISINGLYSPIWKLAAALVSLIPQVTVWPYDRRGIDAVPLLAAWTDFVNRFFGALLRLWEWCAALAAGHGIVDPLAAGLCWSMLLWLVIAWSGWQLRRNRQALLALAPGGLMLALALDYDRANFWPLIVYLASLLALMGLTGNERRHIQWKQRGVDYSESIRLDTLVMVALVTASLVVLATIAPSLSWRNLVNRFREAVPVGGERVIKPLGLESPSNVANEAPYRSGGLPRSHLLDLPPDLSERVVFTVRTGELPPISNVVVELHPNRYYWRAITYDVYNGAGWNSSPAQEVPLPANTPLLELPPGYRALHQQIQLTPGQGNRLHWSGILAQVDADARIAWRAKPPPHPDPLDSGDILGALTDAEEYAAISYVQQVSASRLRASGSDYPADIRGRYLQLPESLPRRVSALARDLTQAALDPYDRALSIERYLRTFPYTLEVEAPPPGRDVADYFLFTARKGYCDYYATSMVVLARAAGLPARLVIGYAGGEYDAPAAEYIVREKDAHSWVEIYFTGVGWVEFEPTASQPVPLRSDEGNVSGAPDRPADQSVSSWLKAQWRALVSALDGQILIAGIVLLILLLSWEAGEMALLYLLPTSIVVQYIYSRLDAVSARLLPSLPRGHTPHELQFALRDRLGDIKSFGVRIAFVPANAEIEEVVALFVAQIFSQHPPARKCVHRGVRSWNRLRWRLWLAIGWFRCLSGRDDGQGG